MDPSGGRGGSMTTMPTLTTATLTQWLSAFPLFLSTATSDFIAKLFSGHQRSDCTPKPPSQDEDLPAELGGGKRFPTEKKNGTTSLTAAARKKWDAATEPMQPTNLHDWHRLSASHKGHSVNTEQREHSVINSVLYVYVYNRHIRVRHNSVIHSNTSRQTSMPARINRYNTISIIKMRNNIINKPNPPCYRHMFVCNNISPNTNRETSIPARV